MQAITAIGLDIAKSVFQVHCIDAGGNVVLRRQLKRRYVLAFFQKLPPCLVGIEACASSHYWSRELQRSAEGLVYSLIAHRKAPRGSPLSGKAENICSHWHLPGLTRFELRQEAGKE
jgi:hypothetical protein